MKKITVIFIFLVTTHLGFSQESLNFGKIKEKNFFAIIPYENIQGKIIVKVAIEGESYSFLFDTGAPLALSENLFKKLNLQTANRDLLTDGSGKRQTVKHTVLPEIRLEDLTFLNTRGIVYQDSTAYFMRCFGVDGIIGSNMLRNCVVQIDNPSKKIIITDKAKKLSLKDTPYQKMVLSKTQSNPFITVIFQKDGNRAGDNVLFDTGGQGFLEISQTAYLWFKENEDVFNTLAEGEGAYQIGLHGNEKKQHQLILKAPKVEINKMLFTNIVINTQSGSASRVGSEILTYGKVTLDYPKKRFYFEPYPNIDKSKLSQNPWQVSLGFEDGKTIIGVVWDKELLEKINIGDRVIRIGDLEYASKNLCETLFQETSESSETKTMVLQDKNTEEIKTFEIKRL